MTDIIKDFKKLIYGTMSFLFSVLILGILIGVFTRLGEELGISSVQETAKTLYSTIKLFEAIHNIDIILIVVSIVIATFFFWYELIK